MLILVAHTWTNTSARPAWERIDLWWGRGGRDCKESRRSRSYRCACVCMYTESLLREMLEFSFHWRAWGGEMWHVPKSRIILLSAVFIMHTTNALRACFNGKLTFQRCKLSPKLRSCECSMLATSKSSSFLIARHRAATSSCSLVEIGRPALQELPELDSRRTSSSRHRRFTRAFAASGGDCTTTTGRSLSVYSAIAFSHAGFLISTFFLSVMSASQPLAACVCNCCWGTGTCRSLFFVEPNTVCALPSMSKCARRGRDMPSGVADNFCATLARALAWVRSPSHLPWALSEVDPVPMLITLRMANAPLPKRSRSELFVDDDDDASDRDPPLFSESNERLRFDIQWEYVWRFSWLSIVVGLDR